MWKSPNEPRLEKSTRLSRPPSDVPSRPSANGAEGIGGRDGINWFHLLGRPPSGALGSFPPEVRDTLRRLRGEHPGWGPETLRLELETRLSHPAPLPRRSRIAAFLRREGFTSPYERRQPLPKPEGERPQHLHEVYEGMPREW